MATTVATLVEVAGAGGAAQAVGQPRNGHFGERLLRIHLFYGRGEEKIDSRLLGDPGIPLQIPGISVEVLLRTKLKGIDEDGKHHDTAFFPGFPDQGEACPSCKYPMVGTSPIRRPLRG